MSEIEIKEVLQLEPQDFLTKVKTTPYSLEDKISDLILPVLMNLAKLLIMPFLHPFATIYNTYYFFNRRPDYDAILTPEIVKKVCEKTTIPHLESKLLYILEKVADLAQKMKLGHVDICFLPPKEEFPDLSDKGYHFQIIGLTLSILNRPEEEIAAILAHELAHLKHNDTFKAVARDWIISATYLLFFRCLKLKHFIAAIMLTKAASEAFFLYQDKKIELAADREGMHYLKSSRGTIQWLHKELYSS